MSGSLVQTAFRLAYEISPIVLTGGLAAQIPGQALPIVLLTQGASLVTSLLTGSLPSGLDDFFAHFTVVPSGDLISQQIGHYPFANQSVASNATITLPLKVSVRMDCPASAPGSYATKLAVLTALQTALKAHNSAGGLYTIATPGFIYSNCVMERLSDISGAGSNQVQYQWQFDFEQPLVTLQAAQQAYNSLLSKVAAGVQLPDSPSWSGLTNSSLGGVVGGLGSLVGLSTGSATS